MEKNIDIRVLKTKKNIKKVFFELMDEIGFSKITVRKIIECAEINRSTFYAHYSDKFDLLDELEKELLMGLKNIEHKGLTELILSDFNSDIFIANAQHFATHLKENGKFITLLISEKGDPAFLNKLSEMIKSIWLEENLEDKLTIPQSYAIAALLGMLTSLIIEWVKSDFRETPQEFGLITFKIFQNINRSILN